MTVPQTVEHVVLELEGRGFESQLTQMHTVVVSLSKTRHHSANWLPRFCLRLDNCVFNRSVTTTENGMEVHLYECFLTFSLNDLFMEEVMFVCLFSCEQHISQSNEFTLIKI